MSTIVNKIVWFICLGTIPQRPLKTCDRPKRHIYMGLEEKAVVTDLLARIVQFRKRKKILRSVNIFVSFFVPYLHKYAETRRG